MQSNEIEWKIEKITNPFLEWKLEWEEFEKFVLSRGWVKTSDTYEDISKSSGLIVNVPVYEIPGYKIDLRGNFGGIHTIVIESDDGKVRERLTKEEFIKKES